MVLVDNKSPPPFSLSLTYLINTILDFVENVLPAVSKVPEAFPVLGDRYSCLMEDIPVRNLTENCNHVCKNILNIYIRYHFLLCIFLRFQMYVFVLLPPG